MSRYTVTLVALALFSSGLASMDCNCSLDSLGYECRNTADKTSCYPKVQGACPPGTEELPNCCDHCYPGSIGSDCQNPTDMTCYSKDSTGMCPYGTLKCPSKTRPALKFMSNKCESGAVACPSNSYCGDSTDPDAKFNDGSGCSCSWGMHFIASNKTCGPGSCNGQCHSDPTKPCLGINGPVCFPLYSGVNECPAGTKDCRYGAAKIQATQPAFVAGGFDNCKSCQQQCQSQPGTGYQCQCQDPKNGAACYPRTSADQCPPGTQPCHVYACPKNSYISHSPPSNFTDCTCDYGCKRDNATSTCTC